MLFFIHCYEHSNSCCESNMQIKMRKNENIYVLTVYIYQCHVMKGCREKMYYVVLWLTSKFIYASSHTYLSSSANNASADNHNSVELSKTRLIGLMTLQQN